MLPFLAGRLPLAGALCCLLGAGFLVFADFGGTWDVQASSTVTTRGCWDGADGTTTCTDRDTTRSEEYYFYEVAAGPAEATALVATAGAFSAAAALALSGRRARLAALLAASAVLSIGVITIVFVAESVGSGDWWFDAGFYGGLSAGLTGAALLALGRSQGASDPPGPAPQGKTI